MHKGRSLFRTKKWLLMEVLHLQTVRQIIIHLRALCYYNAIVGVTISSTATVVVFDNTSSVNDTFEKFDPNNEAQYFGDGNYITYNGIEYLPLAQTIGGVKSGERFGCGNNKGFGSSFRN